MGGLPKGATTLVSGTAGSGKTVLATQFLAEGIQKFDEGAVFVTFEETPGAIRKHMRGFGWDIAAWEEAGKWAFVNAVSPPDRETVELGDFDFAALLARVENAVRKTNARRVSIDSIYALFDQFENKKLIRRELQRIASMMREMDVTTIITAERDDEDAPVTRYGLEQFVADNVVIMRNVRDQEKRRRMIEILKFRGTMHQKGDSAFTILPDQGLVIIPLSAMELEMKSSTVRITSGNDDLDKTLGGGFFRDSIILVSGATGNGKTLLTAHFIDGGAKQGEKCLLFAFEESREQLMRNATGWGLDFEQMEADGLLRIVCAYPETASLEDHLIRMKHEMDEFQPQRIAVDSLSALERVSTIKSFREFIIAMTSWIKHAEVAGFFTSTTAALMGGTSITETHISTITDTILLMRYVELWGQMRRGLTVLKMRGSRHDKDIFEYSIDETGIHLEKPFRDVSGIISGHMAISSNPEVDRITGMFGGAEPAESDQ